MKFIFLILIAPSLLLASSPIGGSYFQGQQIATPSTPASGYDNLYFKSGSLPAYLNSAGTEKFLSFSTSTLGNSFALATDGSGNVTDSTTTATELTYVHGVTSAIQTQINNLKVENMDGQVAAPGNGTFYIRAYANYAGTINSIYIGTASGTDTVAININGSPVTGLSAISVSSSAATSTASAANTFTSGQQITLVTSSDSSAVNLYWSMSVTRQ